MTYLLEDGVILPGSASDMFGVDELSDDEELIEKVDDDDNDDDEDSNAEGDVDSPSSGTYVAALTAARTSTTEDFQDLTSRIKQAIVDLKGEVFVKLNWSAPLDASWLKGGSLKCLNSSEVYLLLKSSDRITFDIEHMFDLCVTNKDDDRVQLVCPKRPETFHLILRSWANLNPAMEFRLFVGNQSILGICQRDMSTYYDFLKNDMDDLEDLIVEFWENNVCAAFGLDKYSVDVYVDKRRRVWIVDFNPFGDPSTSLLFDWEELLAVYNSTVLTLGSSTAAAAVATATDVADDGTTTAAATSAPSQPLAHPDFEFRIIERQADALPSPAGASRGPIDVTLAPDFHKFMEICKQQQREDDIGSSPSIVS